MRIRDTVVLGVVLVLDSLDSCILGVHLATFRFLRIVVGFNAGTLGPWTLLTTASGRILGIFCTDTLIIFLRPKLARRITHIILRRPLESRRRLLLCAAIVVTCDCDR